MIEIKDKTGKVVSRSFNQRQLRRMLSKIPAGSVSAWELSGGRGRLMIRMVTPDERFCEFEWVSFYLMMTSLRNWRNLYGATLYVNGVNKGELQKTNPVFFNINK